MATNTLNREDFINTYNIMYEFVVRVCQRWKDFLIRDNKKATGKLIKSIKPIEIYNKNGDIIGEIMVADYWKYVEYGRKPGKWPPYSKILDWVKVKPVLPRPINGVKPSREQLAFLIQRKIGMEGIEPGNQYEEALNLVWQEYQQRIEQAINIDLDKWLGIILSLIHI